MAVFPGGNALAVDNYCAKATGAAFIGALRVFYSSRQALTGVVQNPVKCTVLSYAIFLSKTAGEVLR